MKTARQLKIKQWELDRLVEVRDRMVKDKWVLSMGNDTPADRKESFCGSAVCLGGNMFALQNPKKKKRISYSSWLEEMSRYVMGDHSDPLSDLFFPSSYIFPDEDESWNRVPEAAMVDAIDVFLEKGKVRPVDWKRLRKKHGLKEDFTT